MMMEDGQEAIAFLPLRQDVVVATAGKAGTTWMQTIVTQLLARGSEAALAEFASLHELSPWVAFRISPAVLAARSPQAARAWLAAQAGGAPELDAMAMLQRSMAEASAVARRLEELRALRTRVAASHDGRLVYKTHEAFLAPVADACPCVFVARSGLDSALSLFRHWRDTKPRYREAAANQSGLPPAPLEDAAAFLDAWLDDFDGFGAPRGGVGAWLETVRSWWDRRRHPNVALVHFADLKRDARGQIAKVAAHCGIGVDDAALDATCDHSSLAYMRRHERWFELDTLEPGAFLRGGGADGGGAATFSRAQIDRYEAVLADGLGADCRRWLRDGGAVPKEGDDAVSPPSGA